MRVTDHAFSLSAQGGDYLKPGEWLAAVTCRWLPDGHRIFVGHQEIGHSDAFDNREIHFIDLHASHMLTKRLSLSVTLPFKYAESTSKYEHDFKNTFNSFALSAPAAVDRYRARSVPNRRAGVHYGAAFTDFLIQASYSRRF